MYETIPENAQATAQRAMQDKYAKAYGQTGILAAAPARDKPMLDVEYDQLEKATLELDQSVQWLIQRIQPICQPSPVGNATEGAGSREPEAPSSEMRTKLKNLRGMVENISSRIAEVRYTIEV